MGKFISKSIANEVAFKMADKVFGEIILSKQKAYYESVEKVYIKLIPSHVLAISREMGEYFVTSYSVGVRAYDDKGNATIWLYALLSFPVPSLKHNLVIPYVDYNVVVKFWKDYENSKRKRDELANSIIDIFMSFKSYKLIRERFPESAPFIDPYDKPVKQLPMVQFDDIRELFK